MIVKCKECGEEYDDEMFPVCPFCMTYSDIEETTDISEIPAMGDRVDAVAPDEKSVLRDVVENPQCEDTFVKEGCEADSTADVEDTSAVTPEMVSVQNEAYLQEETSILNKEIQLNTVSSLSRRAKNVLQRQGIFTLSDLIAYMKKDDLNNLRNAGAKTVAEIEDFVIKLLSDDEEAIIDITSKVEEQVTSDVIFKSINDQLRDLDIEFLIGFNIRAKQIRALKNNHISSLKDLEGMDAKRIIDIVGYYNTDRYRELAPLLQMNLIDLCGKALKAKENDDTFAIVLMRAEGYTLIEIGSILKLTRERVRQIVDKYLRSLDVFLIPIVDYLMARKGYVTVQELLDLYDNDDYDKIIIYWGKNNNHIRYLDFAEIFLPNNENNRDVEEKMRLIVDELVGDGVNLKECLGDLESLLRENKLDFIDTDAFLAFAQQNGYRVLGDYVVKGKQSYGKLCVKVVEKYFPEGIKLYDSHDMDLLREYTIKEFGDIGLSSDDRALSSRIAGYLVLRGRGLYIAESKVYVEPTLLNTLKEYIDGRPEAEIYYSDLFAKFEGLIRMMSSIDNYNYLHGVLKQYYNQEYDFQSRDYLKKNGDGLISGKLNDKLRAFIETKGRPVLRNEIRNEFPGLTDIVLLNMLQYDEELLAWEYKTYTSMKNIDISEREIAILENVISKKMSQTNGYCSDNMLYTEVNNYYPSIIRKNQMGNPSNLYYLCAKLFSKKYDFRRPHICRLGLINELSIKNVALHMLGNPERIHFAEFKKIADKLQWSEMTTGIVFSDMQDSYFRVDEDLLIKTSSVKISDDVLSAIRTWLNDRIAKGYFSLITADYDGLPEFGFSWNNYLMKSIIKEYLPEFRLIENDSKLYKQYDRCIVVRADANITSYVDLVLNVMESRNIYELPENKMLTLLILEGLTYKYIPKELYVSEKTIIRDGIFYILKR